MALWDAPFLPGTPGGPSFPLDEGTKLPLLARRQLAAQMAAVVAFLLDQGFYPERCLLRRARFTRTPQGPWLQLSGFPRWSLEHPRLSRALARGRNGERLPWLVLRPFLDQLLPEYRRFWEDQGPEADLWAFPRLLVRDIAGRDKGGRALNHPLGWGRFLWARGFRLPEEGGVFHLDDHRLATRLGELGLAVVGEFGEEELAPRQAQALTGELPPLVVTTVALPHLPALPLSEASPFWCLLPPGGEGPAGGSLAGLELRDSVAAASALGRAVTQLWEPEKGASTDLVGFLSPPARRLVSVLEGSGVGLTTEEATQVAGSSEALPELRRFGLVVQHFGRWFSCRTTDARFEVLAPWRPRLPAGPLRWALEAAAGGSAAPLAGWCEARLEEGKPEAVLGLRPLAGGLPPLRPYLVEAALTAGWLALAEPWLDQVPSPLGLLFQLWWGVAAGDDERVERTLAVLPELPVDQFPPRLRARLGVLRATVAERRGDVEEAQRLGRWVLELPGLSEDLQAEAAYLVGDEPLEQLAQRSGAGSGRRQRAWHLLGVRAMHRGDTPAAETYLRRALQSASGANPLRFGELLADAGAVAMLLDKPLQAERLFSAAEFWLGLSGSRRALRLVGFNRAVLANDRLQWRKARELLQKLAREAHREALPERAFWLVEWGRSYLVQGEVAQAAAVARELADLMEKLPGNQNLTQGLAVLRAHVALAQGELNEAREWGEKAEPSERSLFATLFAARGGTAPEVGLPDRWGLVSTAKILHLAQRDPDRVGGEVVAAVSAKDTEPALGLARALLVAPAWGLDLVSPTRKVLPRLKTRLREAGLDGWARLLEARCGRDWAEILGLVAALQRRSADFWGAPEWQALVHALGLAGLAVTLDGRDLVRVGALEGGASFEVGVFCVTFPSGPDPETEAVLRLVLERAPVPLAGKPGDDLGLTGTSPAMAALREAIARYAPLPVTVLILGEPGTGKERVARALHRLSGRRGEFVAVNCAGLPEHLLEAELFGVVRGAFTGADRDRPGLVEHAEGGTLFLDEVGELPLSMQAKLLRLLQEREVRRVGGLRPRKVDVRFVAATNRDLARAVEQGSFRRDLYDRLAVATLRVPPLRERVEDIPLLVGELVTQFAAQFGFGTVVVEPELLRRLSQYPWPGNVRELESVVVQALVRCPRGEPMGSRHLPADLVLGAGATPEASVPPLELAEREFFRDYFRRLLRQAGGNRTRAAKIAGLSRQALLYRLRQLGLGGTEGTD